MLLKVQCPHCGYVQTTRSVKRVKCWNCGRTYQVFYKRSGSRIVEIVEGTRAELFKAYERAKRKEVAE